MIDVGYGNIVNKEKIVAIANTLKPSAPIKRKIKQARETGYCIDLTAGKPTRSVIFMDSGEVVLTSRSHRTLKKVLKVENMEDDDCEE